MSDLLQDLRFGARMLVKRPGTSALAVIALALGIGLTATMFSIVQGAFLRGLPFEQSDRLISVARVNRTRPGRTMSATLNDLVDWRLAQHSFEGLAGFDTDVAVVSGGLAPERYRGARITTNTLHLLRVTPILGRDFVDADGQPGSPPVAIISYQIWTSQFRQDPSVIGRLVRISGTPASIVGVMPPKFGFPQLQDLWRPLPGALFSQRGDGHSKDIDTFGRLQPGVSLGAASVEMAGIARQLEQKYAENKDLTTDLVRYIQRAVSAQAIATLFAMLGAVFGVMLIACANVMNLQLARAAERSKEVAIRTALGAGRARIVRQMLIEGLLLASAGALIGLGITEAGVSLFRRAVVDTNPPFWMDFRIDGTVLAFVTAITIVAAIVSSLIPALRASRADLNSVLKDEGRSNTGVQMGRFGRNLVIAEVLLSCCLLVVSGLMVKSVVTIGRIHYPFATDDVFSASVLAADTKYKTDADLVQIADRVVERLASVPGIHNVAISSGVPTPGGGAPLSVEGKTYATDTDRPQVRRLTISPSFFDVLRVGVSRGRPFASTDTVAADKVAIVDEDFARSVFPGADPVGRRVKFGGSATTPWMTIVGIVPSLVVAPAPGDTTATVYVPLAQAPLRTLGVLAATSGDPVALTPAIRSAILELDEDMALSSSSSLAAVFWQRTWAFRVFGALFMSFGFAALVLAGAGLYGVMAFSVRRRTQEIGVRMALGSDRSRVVKMVLWQGLWRVALGIGLGLVPAWFLGGLMKLLLFNVSQGDPTVFGVTVAALLASGFAASVVPAMRAASVDPLVALRHD